MTIYIYGSKGFKNSIHKVFEQANMKFRLSEDDSIIELASLENLKEAIEENPSNIFLIDDNKIIKKNSLNDKIKFLKPKDGIEEDFLKEYGIGDLSVDEVEDIATHVIKKLEKSQDLKQEQKIEALEKEKELEAKNNKPINNDYEFNHGHPKKTDSLQEDEFITSFVEKDLDTEEDEDDDYDFDIDEALDLKLDENEEQEDDLKEENGLFVKDNDTLDEFEFEINDDEDDENEEELFKSISTESLKEEDFGITVEEIEETQKNDEANEIEEIEKTEEIEIEKEVEKIEKKGENSMEDEFSELDNLNENELLEALNGSTTSDSSKSNQNSSEKSSTEVELNSNSVNELSSLITQLLNNKTLEITIKIKE